MRFMENGPDIPDTVLRDRDEGRVVFLCGAGVSQSAGLPSFVELARMVSKALRLPADSDIAGALSLYSKEGVGSGMPLDEVFYRLQRRFGRKQVDGCIADAIEEQQRKAKSTRAHEIVGRISSDQLGKPQIVTTNFDTMFDCVWGNEENAPNPYVPPNLPRIDVDAPITGITHLHGRLNDDNTNLIGYTISSADLGMAYLVGGWATNFVRSLFELYTVILVGYRAEDPPIRYLLQGLGLHRSNKPPIAYAFERGTPEEAREKWERLGITSIAYPTHDQLWSSLARWAQRADAPKVWRNSVLTMAAKGPRACTPVQRGQVVHVIGSNSGAQEFIRTRPSPPPEWLCVFDERCRLAREKTWEGQSKTPYDPRLVYGIDTDDISSIHQSGNTSRDHSNPLEWYPDEESNPIPQRLGEWYDGSYQYVPERVDCLVNWIVGHLGAPVTVWWALKNEYLHENLVNKIRSKVSGDHKLSAHVRHLWNIILEWHLDKRSRPRQESFYRVIYRAENEGWSSSVLRDFERHSVPMLELNCNWPIISDPSSLPPTLDDSRISDFVRVEVKFPHDYTYNMDIPDCALVSVFRTLESNLYQAISMWKDVSIGDTEIPTCYPDRGTLAPKSGICGLFRLIVSLYGRLAKLNPTLARSYAMGWSMEDHFLIRKLKLFTLNQKNLFDKNEVRATLNELPTWVLWDFNVRHELLFLLCDRCRDLSRSYRKKLVWGFLDGPGDEAREAELPPGWEPKRVAAWYLQWLLDKGFDMSKKHRRHLGELIAGIPDWKDGEHIGVASWEGDFVRWLDRVRHHIDLTDVPIPEVVEKVLAGVGKRDIESLRSDPFAELIRVKPQKAVESLDVALRKGVFPQGLWRQLVESWPAAKGEELYVCFLDGIGRLSCEQVQDIGSSLGKWFSKHFGHVLSVDRDKAWKSFDHVTASLQHTGSAGGECMRQMSQSGLNKSDGVSITLKSAKRSPIGGITLGLLQALKNEDLEARSEIPETYIDRIHCLIDGPTTMRYQAISVLSSELDWLHCIAPEWSRDVLIPLFDVNDSAAQAAWSGVQDYNDEQYSRLSKVMQKHLLTVFPAANGSEWDYGVLINVAQWIVSLVDFSDTGSSCVPIEYVSDCLRRMEELVRNQIIPYLGDRTLRSEGGWKDYFVPFARDVWPRELMCQSSDSSFQWVGVLVQSGEDFPEVLKAIRHLLCPITHGGCVRDIRMFGGNSSDPRPVAMRFPSESLDLLEVIISTDPENVPVDLNKALDMIASSSDQELTRDPRWIRLYKLWDRR